MTPLRVDHVTIAGADLDALRAVFAGLGLATDYGGPHSNGITHMALLGLPDSSYVELISTLQPGQTDHRFWPHFIAGDGGPCAWAVRVEDVAAEAARLSALGVPVDGPARYFRERPDGLKVEWDLAFVGEGSPGSLLPFIIKDRTPREWRVGTSESVAGDEAGLPGGVAQVVLGVAKLESSVDRFRRAYGWGVPQSRRDPDFGAQLAHFVGTPVTLASPLAEGSWLAARLSQFGDAPCAFLLRTDAFEAACKRYDVGDARTWFGGRAAWFAPLRQDGFWLGLLG